MIRALVPSVLLFFLPFALYFLWLGYRRRRYAEDAIRTRRHFVWITLTGSVLALAGFVFFTDFSGAKPDEVYIPPRYENGKLIHGHFAPRTSVP